MSRAPRLLSVLPGSAIRAPADGGTTGANVQDSLNEIDSDVALVQVGWGSTSLVRLHFVCTREAVVFRETTKAPDLQAFRGADARTRTGDPFITSEVLYQLSYVGAVG